MMVSPTGFTTLIENSVCSQSKKGDLITLNKYGYGSQKKKLVNKAGNKDIFYI